MSNLYEILEVNLDADVDTIKKAYKRKVQQYHPDRNNGDDEMFHLVKSAYDTLIDPLERAYYDKTGKVKGKSYGQADAMLAALFSSIIQNNEYLGDMVETCRKKIAVRTNELTKEFLRNEIKMKSLSRQLRRMTCKNFNVFENLVNTQLELVQDANMIINEELKLLGEVSVLLDDYKDTAPEENSFVNFEVAR